MCRPATQTSRRAFTIVELLVSMALIIFILYVIAEAFSAGSSAFRSLKSIGDMNERLRSASTVIRRLLEADHFTGRKRLSDRNFWDNGPPQEGFFRIWQQAAPINEGTDLDSNGSFRATDQGLHFTTRLRGVNRWDFFYATNLPANSPLPRLWSIPNAPSNYLKASRFQENDSTYTSQWAECAIYLKPTGDDTSLENANLSGTPLQLHTLFLRQRLLVSSNDDVAKVPGPGANPTQYWPVPAANAGSYPEISQTIDPSNNTQLYFNNPADVTMPIRRFGSNSTFSHTVAPGSYPTLGTGDDVLLTDVLSCEIRVLLSPEAYAGQPQEFVTLYDFPATNFFSMGNTQFGTARVFDTWSSRRDDSFDYSPWATKNTDKTIPMYENSTLPGQLIRIVALQITLRIWDSKTKLSRQTSIVVDM